MVRTPIREIRLVLVLAALSFTSACTAVVSENSRPQDAGRAIASDWVYLSNGTVKIGVDRNRGGGIGYFSRVQAERNVLNRFDTGRFVQQSYYGRVDGSTWNGRPWRWNPVQGGSWQNAPSQIVDFQATSTQIYSKTIPRNWGGGELLPEVVMEQWITLSGEIAKVRFKMTYNGSIDHPTVDQEMPAMFYDYKLKNLVYYDQAAPWTNAPTQTLVPVAPDTPGQNRWTSENWAAYVDDTQWGCGAYFPGTRKVAFYRYFGNGTTGPDGADCSYMAPIQTYSIHTLQRVHEYEVYLTIGQLDQIRSRFQSIRNDVDRTPPIGTVDSPRAGQTVAGDAVVGGWALDDTKVASVWLFVATELHATATYGLSRPDVGKAYPQYPGSSASGYRAILKTTQFPNGPLSIRVMAKDLAGNSNLLASSTVTVANPVASAPPLPTPTPQTSPTPTPSPSPTPTPSPAPTPTSPPALPNVVLLYQCDRGEAQTNQLAPRIRLVNSSNVPVALASLKVRYYFTKETTSALQFALWWSDLANAASVVQSNFVSISRPNADTYFELSFAPAAGSIASGSSIEIAGGINNASWTTMTQTDDASFLPQNAAMARNAKMTLWFNGQLLSGEAP